MQYGQVCFFFSFVVNGLGWLLCNFGIVVFLLFFKCKLHTIREPQQYKSVPSFKLVIRTVVGVIFVATSIVFGDADEVDIVTLHIHILFNISVIYIFIPKYYASQNPNLKLYIRFYHHQPPPVLPWQMPENFDPDSVKLTYALTDSEHIAGNVWRDPSLS